MRRKNYLVTSTEGHRIVKHAWKSALTATVDLARELAKRDLCFYERTASQVERDGHYRVRGSFTWTGRNGHTVIFSIALQSDDASTDAIQRRLL